MLLVAVWVVVFHFLRPVLLGLVRIEVGFRVYLLALQGPGGGV